MIKTTIMSRTMITALTGSDDNKDNDEEGGNAKGGVAIGQLLAFPGLSIQLPLQE